MYWYDGQLIEEDKICLPITDPGLIYGATVFTTLRVYEQSLQHRLTQWEAHCHRLEKSLRDFWVVFTKLAKIITRRTTSYFYLSCFKTDDLS